MGNLLRGLSAILLAMFVWTPALAAAPEDPPNPFVEDGWAK